MPETTQKIHFILNDQPVEVACQDSTMTLLEFLREEKNLKGTKEGCAEGDCGACTVLLGDLNQEKIQYRAINSCIRFLPSLHGKSIITVEAILQKDKTLHPVQQALMDEKASQCGFCTPGFVMSLLALYLNKSKTNKDEVTQTLAGNLCRCTGYRPIVEAGCRMHDYPNPSDWSQQSAQSVKRITQLQSIQSIPSTPSNPLPALSALTYWAPDNIEHLSQAYLENPQALLLAGGTDIGLWVTKQMRPLPLLIDLGNIAALKLVETDPGHLTIGAAVKLTDAFESLTQHYPQLQSIADRFASPPIRNAATLCGNLANGSPIGDCLPVLIALNAQLTLQRGALTRKLALDAFYLGYQSNALQSGEWIRSVEIPLLPGSYRMASYKIAKRHDQDISTVFAAYVFEMKADHIIQARVAYGGMAATAKRAPLTELALKGKTWCHDTFNQAVDCIEKDFTPLSDQRASDQYRRQVAKNLLIRFFLEHESQAQSMDIHHQTQPA